MKKRSLLVVVVIFTFFSFIGKTNAQSKDYYLGKWDIEVLGTPQGDGHAALTLQKVDGKYSGTFAPPGQKVVKINKVEEKGTELTIYFTSNSGYDVYLYIDKVDDDNVAGSMMDMFDVKGKRIKE
jgi:hypothetical protein